MYHSIRLERLSALMSFLLCLCLARVGVAGTSSKYEGQLDTGGTAGVVRVEGELGVGGKHLSGTLSVSGLEAGLSGTYALSGWSVRGRVRLRGRNESGAKLLWSGSAAGNAASGRVWVWNRMEHRKGTIELTVVAPTGAGASLFAANCAGCHASDASGGYGPDIHCNRNIRDTVIAGRVGAIGVMPAFPGLGDAEIASIQEFLGGLCGVSTPADLYAGNCSACHGSDGSGTPGRPDIRCTVTSRILHAVRHGRGAGSMPVFAAAALPDGDVVAIASHLAGFCSGLPGDRFASNCATCHGVTAGGGRNADGVRGPNIRCTGTHDFLEKLRFGDEAMPAFPELGSTESGGVASFVQQNFCPLEESGGGEDD